MKPRAPHQPGDRLLMAVMLLVGALLAAQGVSYRPSTAPIMESAPATQRAAEGMVREVDVGAIRRRIAEGRLSNRDAEFYRRLEQRDGGSERSER